MTLNCGANAAKFIAKMQVICLTNKFPVFSTIFQFSA